MQLTYFKIFVDLVEMRSFSDTANLNGITKAAVSQQIRVIERHFNALLIDRGQKRFELTSEGRRVYEGAKELLSQYEKVVRDLEEMKEVVSGTIRISTVASIGLHILPPYLKKFQEAYPSVSVQVIYRRTDLVYKDVLSNTADFGFVAFPVQTPDVEVIPFLNDQLVLITHPTHALARNDKVELSALAGQKLIGFGPGGPAHDAISQIFRENKIKMDTMMVFDNFETVIRAVEIGAGIAFVPEMTAMEQIKRGSVKALQCKGNTLIRPLAVVHRKGRVFMPAMKRFLEMLHTDSPAQRKSARNGHLPQ